MYSRMFILLYYLDWRESLEFRKGMSSLGILIIKQIQIKRWKDATDIYIKSHLYFTTNIQQWKGSKNSKSSMFVFCIKVNQSFTGKYECRASNRIRFNKKRNQPIWKLPSFHFKFVLLKCLNNDIQIKTYSSYTIDIILEQTAESCMFKWTLHPP